MKFIISCIYDQHERLVDRLLQVLLGPHAFIVKYIYIPHAWAHDVNYLHVRDNQSTMG
jgi:hypothetical protein